MAQVVKAASDPKRNSEGGRRGDFIISSALASNPIKEYVLGPGDVIDISVEQIDEISGTHTISAEGEINFPTLLPSVNANGHTARQLKELLAQLLLEYMYEPKVKVTIVERHSHKVLLLGAFQRPSIYRLKHEEVPLLDLIFEAGGIRELKKDDELIILRNPTKDKNPHVASITPVAYSPQLRRLQSISVDFYSLLKEGDISQNILIRSGDVIYLSSFLSEGNQYVYIVGDNSAEFLPYQKDLTLLKALLRSGIAPNTVDSEQRIKILRSIDNAQNFIEVAFNSQNYWINTEIQLHPEDIIILPDATFNEIYVVGNVYRPGTIKYRKALTLLQAISEVGGAASDADTSEIKIFREDDKGNRQLIFGNLSAMLEDGEGEKNIPINRGDIIVVSKRKQKYISVSGMINQPGLIPYEPNLTLMKAIFKAGGLNGGMLEAEVRIINESGHPLKPIMINLTENTASQTEVSNLVLQPGDLVVVLGTAPSDVIYVTGKIKNSGVLKFQQGMTVFQAIQQTGGFASGAAKSKVIIRRSVGENQQILRANIDDFMKKNDRTQNISLLPGDIVFVSETLF